MDHSWFCPLAIKRGLVLLFLMQGHWLTARRFRRPYLFSCLPTTSVGISMLCIHLKSVLMCRTDVKFLAPEPPRVDSEKVTDTIPNAILTTSLSNTSLLH